MSQLRAISVQSSGIEVIVEYQVNNSRVRKVICNNNLANSVRFTLVDEVTVVSTQVYPPGLTETNINGGKTMVISGGEIDIPYEVRIMYPAGNS